MDKRNGIASEMTNESHRKVIIKTVRSINDSWILQQIYRYINNIIKEG